jgi:hypothetical protein
MGELLRLCFGHKGELTFWQGKIGSVGRNAVFIWTGRKYTLCSRVLEDRTDRIRVSYFAGESRARTEGDWLQRRAHEVYVRSVQDFFFL